MTQARRTGRPWVIYGSILASLLCLLALGGIYLAGRYALGRMRAAQIPPTVLVRQPTSGARLDPQTPFDVHIETWGTTPITEVSLSLDGRLLERRANANPAAASFHASFQVEVEAGPHVLVARAVDQDGRIGQSFPVSILANADAGAGPLLLNWPAQAGETLADIAAKLGFGPDGLDGVNPNLGGGVLPPGTVVQVPGNPGAPAPQADVIMPDPIPVDTSTANFLEFVSGADVIRMLLSARGALLPPPPSDVQAMYRDCAIILRWDDNSENEAYFNIWMSGLGHSPRIIATASAFPGTGPVWVQFDAPEIGFYSFWVEAVSILGSQPSEVAWVGVIHTDTCAHTIATYLQVELTGLSMAGAYDRFYCYVSANDFPAQRFPPKDGIFIQIAGPPFNIMIGGDLAFRVPIPEPRVLSLEGECLGWLGGDLVNLGPFERTVPESEWDGTERSIDTDTYHIDFTVLLPYPSRVTSMIESQYDLTLPAPYGLRIVSSQPLGDSVQHTLAWNWDGDPDAIYAYSIFIDGVGLGYAQEKSYQLLLPDDCGRKYEITVSALGMDAPSIPSEVLTLTTLPCEVTAEVEFLSLNIYGEVDDVSDCFLDIFPAENCSPYGKICDGYQAVGWLSAEGLSYQTVDIGYWAGDVDLTWPVNCRPGEAFTPHSLAMMTEGKNVFTVPLDPANPMLEIRAVFLDLDQGPDNIICGFTSAERDLPFQHLSAVEWASYDETLEIDCSQETASTVVVRVRGLP